MIRYCKNPELIIEQVLPLYESVGWTNYTNYPDRLAQGLTQSLYLLTAYDGDKLVGMLRAVGDGQTIVFIQDIIVLPSYQRQGIGTQLLEQTLDEFKHVYQLHLVTDNTEKTKRFYTSIGFIAIAELDCLAYTYL